MPEVSAGIAVQIAMTQQAVALEVLKQSADMQQQMAQILQDSIVNVPVSGSLGTVVDTVA